MLKGTFSKFVELGIKNKQVYFVLRSFFRNFGRNRRISLYKGSLED